MEMLALRFTLAIPAAIGLLLCVAPLASAQGSMDELFEDPGVDFEAGDPFAEVPDPFAPAQELPAAPEPGGALPPLAESPSDDAAAPADGGEEMGAPPPVPRESPGAGVLALGAAGAAAAWLGRRVGTRR